MFTIYKEGLEIQVDMDGDLCRMALRGRLAGQEAATAGPVSALDSLLSDLLKTGVNRFQVDITGLREMDIFGFNLLRRLQGHASCRLKISSIGTRIEPLLAVELMTKFEWDVVGLAA